MSTTTEIEKESLEAHVELCAERYAHLNDKLEDLDQRTTKMETVLVQIKEKLFSQEDESNKRYLNWAIGIIVFMATLLLTVGGHYINKLEATLETATAISSEAREDVRRSDAGDRRQDARDARQNDREQKQNEQSRQYQRK